MSDPKEPKPDDAATDSAADSATDSGRQERDLAAVQEKAGAVLAEAADAVQEIETAADEASGGDLHDATPEQEVAPAEVEEAADQVPEDHPDEGHDHGRENDPHHHDPDDDQHDAHEDEHHGSLAAKVLTILVVALVAGGVALWGAPKIAPHVPASVARYLVPADQTTAQEIARLEQALAARAGETEAAIAGLESRIAGLDELRSELEAISGKVEGFDLARAEAESARDRAAVLEADVRDLQARLEQVEAQITALAERISALADRPPAITGATPEDLAEIEQQRAADAALRSAEIAALAARVDALTSRVVEAETEAAQAEQGREAAEAKVAEAVRAAELRGAAAALSSRLASGEPYAEALGSVEDLSGEKAPEALAAGAKTGYRTARALLAGFSPVARRALAADIRAGAEDSTKGRVLAWLQSQVAGRPTAETAGDDVGAILSRVSARLEDGDTAAALAEADSLPAHVQEAMDGWLDELRGRVAAERALAGWLGDLGVSG